MINYTKCNSNSSCITHSYNTKYTKKYRQMVRTCIKRCWVKNMVALDIIASGWSVLVILLLYFTYIHAFFIYMKLTYCFRTYYFNAEGSPITETYRLFHIPLVWDHATSIIFIVTSLVLTCLIVTNLLVIRMEW